MKKILMFVLLTTLLFTLSGCGLFGDDDDKDKIDDYNLVPAVDGCKGEGDYIVVDGVCLLISDVLSGDIRIDGEETVVQYSNSVELMTDFVADLTDSKGLAVVSRSVFDATLNTGGATEYDLINLAATANPDETTANLIVKLTEEGFFEEVSFSDSTGLDVEIMANPLVLEIYGAYTIVIFEVDLGYDNQSTDFSQKVYDSLYSGGIYIIHNESGKLFATKEVTFTENTYTYTEDHSRYVYLTVTLNEPVIETQYIQQFDEFNNPIYDTDGQEVYDEILVPLLDSDGNPIVFTEGPILTEFLELPLVEYFIEQEVDGDGNLLFDEEGNPIFVQELDEEGNPLFDEDGNPVFVFTEQPILDENGDQIIEIMEIPLYDEDGNIRYQEQFDVELYIEDIVEITYTEHYANVIDNPLSNIAQKFVDKIISEYYSWDYYRVNNYMITSHGFSASDENIFYMEMKVDENDAAKQENFVMRLSYDSETDEIILEEYINATKAGFTDCEIIIDPRNNNIICDSWDGNIKVYSDTEGLKTIPDSEFLNPVTFPNGELYFYDSMETYVEELGYFTTTLYNINSDGTLESHFIELGEKAQVCIGECDNYIDVDYYDENGNEYGDYGYISLHLVTGDELILSADLQILEMTDMNSTRPECTDVNGCWGSTMIEILDEAANSIATFDQYFNYFGDEQVPFGITYQLDAQTEYDYELQWSQDDEVCDNDIGCTSQTYLVDNSINEYGLWMYENIIVSKDEKMVQYITLAETNLGVYNYTKEVAGEVCEYDTCDEYIDIMIYDADGNLLSNYQNQVEVLKDEIIPLYIEYHMSSNSTVTERTGVCTTSTGCWEYYTTPEGYYYYINYEQGDTVYETIEFVASDKTVVTEETLTSETCTEVNGCYGQESEYIIVNDNLDVLYTFSNDYTHVEYGYRMPYTVTINIDDVTVDYKKVSTELVAVCEEETCRKQVEFGIGPEPYDFESIGWGYVTFLQGDELVYRIRLADNDTYAVENNMICNFEEGCNLWTENFIVKDAEGNVFDTDNEYWYTSVQVFFEKGEVIPSDQNFTVTFEMTNIEYQKDRIFVYDFIWRLNDIIILDENLFLIERDAWAQGEDNFVLTYNDVTGRYSAKYTNISAVTEITKTANGYIAINDDETAIFSFSYDETKSDENYYYFDVANLTEGLQINGVNDLIVDYDGSIYFKGVDNFIQDITGTISQDGVVTIDTEYVEREIIRVSPIN